MKQNFPACIKAWANEFGDHFSSPMSLSMAKKLFQHKMEKVSYFPFGAPLTLCTFKFQNGNGHLFQITQIHPQNKINGIPKASNQSGPALPLGELGNCLRPPSGREAPKFSKKKGSRGQKKKN